MPNAQLRLQDLPAPDADWHEHAAFAHSFFAYEHWGSFGAAAVLANRAAKRFREEGVLPSTLSELRTCLFFEHRRAVHQGGPSEEARVYARALLEAIHSRVRTGQLD
ncbi:MAG: hypothetical protein HY561_10800 [Gemmatimonadetes bacterium]|nr:hypothetical protein [Gemmatimonadota bacterium]